MNIILKNAISSDYIEKIDVSNSKLVSITIEGSDKVTGMTSEYRAIGHYDNDTDIDITSFAEWDIINGYEFANIVSGKLTILSNASDSEVDLKVSYNNITANKSIRVTYDLLLSSETKEVLTFYGNKSLTDEQKLAVNDFISIFDKYKSKVDCAMLPILGIEEDIQIPAINTPLKGSYDLIIKDYRGVRQQDGETPTVKVGKNGITSTGIEATGNDRATLFDSGVYLKNYSVIAIGVLSDSGKININPVTVCILNESSIGIQSINAVSGSIIKTINKPTDDSIINLSLSVDVPNHDVKVYTAHNKEYIHDTESITVDEPSRLDLVGTETRLGYGESYKNQALSVYIMGETLSEEELKVLSDACYELVKKLVE